MIRVTLDTSAYSAFKRGHAGVVGHLRRAEQILLPSVVLGELLGGFRVGQHGRRNHDELFLFRESPRVRVVPIGEATAERYAVIYAGLRATGQPIPTNDLWIAASAMEHGTELVTLDRDFAHVPQILLSLYEPQ
jgi:tRNA(fMet)-specific endonuclease VapC